MATKRMRGRGGERRYSELCEEKGTAAGAAVWRQLVLEAAVEFGTVMQSNLQFQGQTLQRVNPFCFDRASLNYHPSLCTKMDRHLCPCAFT